MWRHIAQSHEGQSRRGVRSSQGTSGTDGSARSSQGTSGTGGSGSGGPQWSSAGFETQEIIRLLSHLVSSTPSGAAGHVTQPFAPTGSAAASQSSTLGPPSTSTSGSSHGSAGWYWLSSS
nr:sericin-1-like [Setaria viridis]